MTLTAWVDILGSTMLGRAPTFANTYRTKHLSGSASGLKELMGCHDSVMYILSEVACLDSLRVENKLDDIAICSHITSLAQQLDATEPTHENLQSPFSKSGALRTAPIIEEHHRDLPESCARLPVLAGYPTTIATNRQLAT